MIDIIVLVVRLEVQQLARRQMHPPKYMPEAVKGAESLHRGAWRVSSGDHLGRGHGHVSAGGDIRVLGDSVAGRIPGLRHCRSHTRDPLASAP